MPEKTFWLPAFYTRLSSILVMKILKVLSSNFSWLLACEEPTKVGTQNFKNLYYKALILFARFCF
jgi:hypothetical protein